MSLVKGAKVHTTPRGTGAQGRREMQAACALESGLSAGWLWGRRGGVAVHFSGFPRCWALGVPALCCVARGLCGRVVQGGRRGAGGRPPWLLPQGKRSCGPWPPPSRKSGMRLPLLHEAWGGRAGEGRRRDRGCGEHGGGGGLSGRKGLESHDLTHKGRASPLAQGGVLGVCWLYTSF